MNIVVIVTYLIYVVCSRVYLELPLSAYRMDGGDVRVQYKVVWEGGSEIRSKYEQY